MRVVQLGLVRVLPFLLKVILRVRVVMGSNPACERQFCFLTFKVLDYP